MDTVEVLATLSAEVLTQAAVAQDAGDTVAMSEYLRQAAVIGRRLRAAIAKEESVK